jgi:hypothetical protein
MSLLNKLEESEEYEEVENSTPGLKNAREFQNLIDEESHTVLLVLASEENGLSNSRTYSVTFYFEISNKPYYFETYVTDEDELKEFKRDGENLMVEMINKYNAKS